MGERQLITDKNGRRSALSPCDEPCPIERGMRILGGKWTGSILWHLADEPVRFNDLSRQLGGASKKVITDRLKQMEANGLIKRRVISTQPIAVSYQITEFGRTSLAFLETLKDWAIQHNI